MTEDLSWDLPSHDGTHDCEPHVKHIAYSHNVQNTDRLFTEFDLFIDKDVKYEKLLCAGLWLKSRLFFPCFVRDICHA
jgi:hypothetical protein